MGYNDREKEKKRLQEQAEADRQWFALRMKSLVSELESVKSVRQANYLRTCLQEAMGEHARLFVNLDGMDTPAEKDF